MLGASLKSSGAKDAHVAAAEGVTGSECREGPRGSCKQWGAIAGGQEE